MLVWRVTNHVALDGKGGLYAAGRWHSKGRRVVYCAPNPASALLEMLVHAEIDVEDFPGTFRLLKIEIPETVSRESVDVGKLPSRWRAVTDLTRGLGDRWLAERRSLLLFVPSAIVPETQNILLNPEHSEAKGAKIVGLSEHPLDERLLGAR